MDELKVGDPVEVLDPGLLALYNAMKHYNPNTKPNNIGVVGELPDDPDDDYMIYFPIGDDPMEEHSQAAPYPREMIRKIKET